MRRPKLTMSKADLVEQAVEYEGRIAKLETLVLALSAKKKIDDMTAGEIAEYCYVKGYSIAVHMIINGEGTWAFSFDGENPKARLRPVAKSPNASIWGCVDVTARGPLMSRKPQKG